VKRLVLIGLLCASCTTVPSAAEHPDPIVVGRTTEHSIVVVRFHDHAVTIEIAVGDLLFRRSYRQVPFVETLTVGTVTVNVEVLDETHVRAWEHQPRRLVF